MVLPCPPGIGLYLSRQAGLESPSPSNPVQRVRHPSVPARRPSAWLTRTRLPRFPSRHESPPVTAEGLRSGFLGQVADK